MPATKLYEIWTSLDDSIWVGLSHGIKSPKFNTCLSNISPVFEGDVWPRSGFDVYPIFFSN